MVKNRKPPLRAGTRVAWQPLPRFGVIVEHTEIDGRAHYLIRLDDSRMPDVPLPVPADEVTPCPK